MNKILRYMFLLCALGLWAFSAFAEDISFEASVDADKIPMGTAGQLVLTVRGTQDVDKIDLPPLEGVEVRYIGPSTQVRVINGAYSTAKAFTYMLLPLKEGVVTIPPVEVSIKGQVYRSQPLTLQVVSVGSDATAASDDPQTLADKVRTTMSVARNRCYVNEELPLVIKLYVRDLPMEGITLPDISQKGFILSEYSQPRQYEEMIDGKTFHVVEFSTRLTPLKSGPLSVGPAVIGASLVYKTNVRPNPFGKGSPLEDEFFTSFFGGFQKRPLTISAPPLDLQVMDLPVEGVPDHFSGAVGRFTFDAAISPVKVQVGDPVTLRMTVSGMGSLKGITMPSVEDARFKIYEPTIKEEGGAKVLEQVLIPTKAGDVEVPQMRFSYFDVETSQYQTLTRGPFVLNVEPLAQGQEFRAVGFTEGTASLLAENFGKDIVFIKDRPGNLKKRHDLWGREGLFYGVLIIFLNIWGALLSFFLYRRHILSDKGLTQRALAYRQVRAAQKALASFAAAGETRSFYGELSGALKMYFVGKLGLMPGEVAFGAVEKALGPYGVPQKELDKLKGILAMADRVQFAGYAASAADMKRDYLDMEEVVEAIERRVR